MYLVSRTQLQILTNLTLKEFTGKLQINYTPDFSMAHVTINIKKF
jgi:hypothetical protein